MKRALLSLAIGLALVLTAPSAGAAESKSLASSGAFGVTGGAITGSGLAYRQFFDETWGAQLAGFIWSTSSIFFGDIGVQGMYTVHQKEGMRFYLPFGFGVYKTTNKAKDDSSTTTFLGAGYGMMFDIGRSWLLAIDLPLCLRLNNTTSGGTSTGGIYPVPSLSFLYAF